MNFQFIQRLIGLKTVIAMNFSNTSHVVLERKVPTNAMKKTPVDLCLANVLPCVDDVSLRVSVIATRYNVTDCGFTKLNCCENTRKNTLLVIPKKSPKTNFLYKSRGNQISKSTSSLKQAVFYVPNVTVNYNIPHMLQCFYVGALLVLEDLVQGITRRETQVISLSLEPEAPKNQNNFSQRNFLKECKKQINHGKNGKMALSNTKKLNDRLKWGKLKSFAHFAHKKSHCNYIV